MADGIPERRNPCRDCAFAADSPEREFASGGCRSGGASMVEMIEERLRNDIRDNLEDGWLENPFFCHEGLETVEIDGWRYVNKVPKGAKFTICAGFAAARDRITAEVRADG